MDPEEEPTVSLSHTVKNSASALDFYSRALGAKELYRMPIPDGGVAHAEFMIGDTRIYMSDEAPDWHAVAMPEDGTSSCLFSISTDDCDNSYERAMEAGATSLNKPKDEFWGSRAAMIRGPFGYRWSFSQQIEDLSPEEIAERANQLFS